MTTRCKSCKKNIPKKAKQCPHCNIKNTTVTIQHTLIAWGILIIGGWWFFSWISGDKTSVEQQALAEQECMKTIKCWGEKHYLQAGMVCQSFIPKLAKYSHQWTDGTFEPKFSHYRWKNPQTGELTVIGDKIQFQTGLGAHQNMTYECDYDPKTKQVLDVRVMKGYL